MNGLRVVFMGTPQFALPSLEKIHLSRHQIAGVVSQPDRPRGRGRKLESPPVKQFALEHGLFPIWQPEQLSDRKFIEQLKDIGADIFIVVAFRILPEAVFTIPPQGTVNLHPSLLPKYRGAAPINWAIINGEKMTGITTIFIQKEVDAGNIILQKEVPIQENETAGSLHDRLAELGAELLLETLDRIESGVIQTSVQDVARATRAPRINKELAHLKFDQPAVRVKNWIHGLSPIPGAYAFHQNKMLKFYRARLISEASQDFLPGTVVRVAEKDLWVACSPGIIAVEQIQLQGKRVLPTEEFLRGYHLKAGEVFR